MGWRDAFSFLTSQKYQDARTTIAFNAASAVSMPRDYESFSREAYQKNVIAYACVRLIASSVASIPILLYNSQGEEVQGAHPLLTLIDRPNPLQSRSAFMRAVVTYKQIAGNSYIRLVPNGERQVAELWPLRPDRIKVIPGRGGMPGAYVYRTYDANNVAQDEQLEVDAVTGQSLLIHLKDFHPFNDWYGLSPIEAAVYGIDSHNESGRMYHALLKNGARPSGALTFSGNLTPAQIDQLKRQLADEYTGTAHSGRPMLLQGGFDWKAFSFSPSDMAWIEGKDTSARDIARAFQVPPMLLGIPGDNTYSNYKEARMAFFENTILPEADGALDDLNTGLAPYVGDGAYLAIDRDQVDALSPKRSEVWERTERSNFLTYNEKREALGYNETDGGDVILVPVSMGPLSDAGLSSQGEPKPEDISDGSSEETSQSEETQPQETSPDQEAGGKSRVASQASRQARQTGARQVKLFNARSEAARSQVWRQAVRVREGYERRFKAQLEALFETEGDHVLAAIDGLEGRAAVVAAEREIDENGSRYRIIIEKHLTVIGKAFGQQVFDALKSTPDAWEHKVGQDTWAVAYRDWVRTRAANAVTGLTATSAERVRQAIRDAMETSHDEGEGAPPLANRIRESVARVYEGDDDIAGFSHARSMLIARTETVAASNAASIEAARASGIPNLRKQWVSSDDERTRDDHYKAGNSDPIALDEMFQVGADRMNMPGEGPAHQVCNCRCAVAYVQEEPAP